MRGIVFEIKAGVALVMKRGGAFVKVTAGEAWQVGDVVAVKRAPRHFSRVLVLAASLLLVVGLATAGIVVYRQPVALISMDINPSIELQLNRFGRVVNARAVNEDAQGLLAALELGNLPYGQAVQQLVASEEFAAYLEADAFLLFTVQAKSERDQRALQNGVREAAGGLLQITGTELDVIAVDAQTVQSAHGHGMSAGKYVLLMELQEALPEMDWEEYAGCGVSELRREIRMHGGGHGMQGGDGGDGMQGGNGGHGQGGDAEDGMQGGNGGHGQGGNAEDGMQGGNGEHGQGGHGQGGR